ncbi:MAG TPA: glycosyltransferase, partial [Acidimicrobiia bacterium]|nr:glycosyltransferase [Acidimicrobiia bacterium]
CYYRGYSEPLAHLIEAGADIFLMPSRFEPCGLNQMYSMAYGTIPIVHATGGLIDSVEPWDGSSGTGFRFAPHDADALAAVLEEAIDVWHDAAARERLIANGMARDDSWDARAEEYRTIYRRAVSSRR